MNPRRLTILLPILCVLLAGNALSAPPVFLEKGGLVVIEAESTTSRLGDWKKKTDVKDFQGECHLEFTGNKPESGPPKSPLKYSFTVSKGGTYALVLRARKRLESKRSDISNDCFVALEGDFTPGGDAPLKVLKSDTKLFGGDADGWGIAKTLDVNHKKYPALYKLKPGETYELTISGRSKNFNIDRILFVHESQNAAKVLRENPAESKRSGGEVAQRRERPTRTLVNKDGKKITAELVEKSGDAISILVRGSKYEIQIDSLSEEDRKFFEKLPDGEILGEEPSE